MQQGLHQFLLGLICLFLYTFAIAVIELLYKQSTIQLLVALKSNCYDSV